MVAARRAERLRESVRSGAKMVRTMKRTFAYVFGTAPGFTAALVVLTAFLSVQPIASLWLVKRLVDLVTAPADVVREPAAFAVLAIGFFALSVLGQGLGTLSFFIHEDITQRLAAASRATLLEKVNAFPGLHYFEIPAFYDQLRNAEQGSGERFVSVMDMSTSLAQSAIVLVASLALLGDLHPLISVAILVGMVPHAVMNWRAFRQRADIYRAQAQDVREQEYHAGVLTSLQTAKEVRAFGLGEYFLGRYRDAFARVFDRSRRFRVKAGRTGVAAGMFSGAVSAGAFVWVIAQAYRGSLTVGDAVLYVGLLPQVNAGIGGFVNCSVFFYGNSRFLAFYFDFLDLPQTAPAAGAGNPRRAIARTGYEFRGVTFRYPGAERPALVNMNLAIAPSEQVALVGRNGAGKTTLVKLLLRLYDPDEGEILLDGVPLAEWDVGELRRRTTAIFQDYAKFSLTVRENIALGDLTRPAPDDWVRAVAAKAQADAFISELSNGYDTVLGKHFAGGTELSGGQWQRIALARAFARDADTVVLDEPTAALDPEAEYELYRRFHELVAGRSALLVTHRLGSVRMVDRVLVLRDGRLVESGSHAALLAAGGEYAELYRMQADSYRETAAESANAPGATSCPISRSSA